MATLATNVSFQCLGLDGKPLAGGKVYTYEAGTTTPKTTYTTMQGDVPNSNPVILDQNGKAKIYLGDGSYRFRILDNNDALVDDTNDISRYVTQSEFAVFQQIINEGISQLTEVREQIDVYVTTAIGNQKGFAGGLVPLNESMKVDPVYISNLNESLFQGYFPSLIPVLFAPIPYPKEAPPSGFLLMSGQPITQAQYPILYSLYGSTLPDLRGVFIRGWDNGRGMDGGRGLMSYQADAFKSHSHNLLRAENSGVGSLTDRVTTANGDSGVANAIQANGDSETRPKNIAFNYIVKAG